MGGFKWLSYSPLSGAEKSNLEWLLKRVEAGALPVMKKMDGFKGYYLISGADDTVVAVAVHQPSRRTIVHTDFNAVD